jgi:hypothetical protein
MSFNQPSRSDVHVNGPLSDISLAYMQSADAFVADRAFPRIGVSKQSDSYFTYDRGYFNRAEMEKRAPGTESAGANYTISTASYSCDVWALHRNIADQIRSNADSPIQLDKETSEFLTLQGLLRKEKEWAAAHFVTGVWTNEVTGVSGAPADATEFQRWDEAASTPIENVRRATRDIHQSTGFRPNRMILGREVYDALLDHPDIVGRLDRGQTSGPAIVMRDALAALFELDSILVMDAIENTAAEGLANVHSYIGGKNVLLMHAAPSPGLMVPSAGYTFTWSGLLGGGALGTRISRMRMDTLKSDRLEIEMAFDQKLVSADLGFFVLTAVN